MRVRVANDAVRGFLWWLPGSFVFFRTAFASGFERTIGDDVDSRFTSYIYEHWVQVAKGNASWTSPEFFYPTKGTLAYSDTFLLNEVFYLPLRGLGMDPFLALQWTIMLLSLVGFVSLFILLRRTLGLSSPVCAALATVFTFANNLYHVAGHTQLYAVYWLPVLLLILLQVHNARDRRVRVAWGWTAGALLGLLFYSMYYTAWFATLALGGFAIVVLVWRMATRGRAAVGQLLRSHVEAAVGATVGFVLAMIPFYITYWPARRLFPDRTYAEVMGLAAWPSDIINLGRDNYLWGSTLRSTLSNERLLFGEAWVAVTPILMLAALAGCVLVLFHRRSVAVGFAGEACVAATIVLVCLTVLPMKFGSRSLWAIAYEFIPGASSMRAIFRVAIICTLIAVLIVALAIRTLRERFADGSRGQRIANAVVVLLLGLIVVEQLNVGNGQQVDRSKQLEELIRAPAPPDACRAFYVIDSGTGFFIRTTIEAMQIGQRFDLPTVNGYSGQFPAGYDFLDVESADYVARVHKWADDHDVRDGLCSYDRYARVWAGPGV